MKVSGRGKSSICLFNGKHRVIQHKVIHHAEFHRGEGEVQLCHTVGILGIHSFVRNLGEVAIGKVHVFHMAVGSAFDHRHSGREGVNVAEIDVAYAGTHVVFSNFNTHREHIVAVDGDVAEAEVFDERCFTALVGHTHFVGIARQAHCDAAAGFGDVQIGEGHVSHHTIVNVGNANSAGVAGQVAVGNTNLFAGLVFF